MDIKTSELSLDPTASERKKDHIELAFQSQLQDKDIDGRFSYEPILSGHPQPGEQFPINLLDSTFQFPLWVSSMTGGTAYAKIINHNLARICSKYGLGMGLGSCRSLLHSDENLEDFAVRQLIGDRPLYANLGIAQIEQLVKRKQWDVIRDLLKKLEASGLIIHINPLQEWTQPEGDRYYRSPLELVQTVLEKIQTPIIVKEVGQGMGKESLRALMKLPLRAIDFAANGGTNFSKLELLRSDSLRKSTYGPIVRVGHSAEQMTCMVNQLLEEMGSTVQCNQFIISGGVKNFLDGYYLISKLRTSAIYGQASKFLKHARESFEELDQYVKMELEGLMMAKSFLVINENQTR